MAGHLTSFSIFPLGDSAITIDLGNCINELHNDLALAIYDWLRANRLAGVQDIIVAYSSVSVFYDPVVVREGAGCDAVEPEADGSAATRMENLLLQAWEEVTRESLTRRTGEGAVFRIPVCYEGEYAPDIEWVAREKALSPGEVAEIHSAGLYRIYMIGFLPGFSYMGRIDERLQLPRKKRPVPVAPGGVGIAGMQTGIYPLSSPGGWQIIGRTPLKLFDALEEPPVRLKTGDRVQFYPVSAAEFRQLSGRPL